ncbi:hypothetical protein TH25_21930 [Thalassospira profundimaris]|uniref:Uncharacterized protein n=1 Tax=Thalassospira profundimaris TaxID=502049 RepID=A0A367WPC2_9PROT|nr:hypothetical protein [Thalassospira profundimaris]RCK43325.1 hypothetical protein TH25_21930 [Thalassospira profundimaris]
MFMNPRSQPALCWHPRSRQVAKWLVLATIITASGSFAAQAQMFEKPWSAPAQNRASLAVVMKQAESGMLSGTGTGASSGTNSLTQLVCGGGGGTANATANSACVILNNSNGTVNTGQDSVGDQTANSNTQTNTTNLSDALENLSGNE